MLFVKNKTRQQLLEETLRDKEEALRREEETAAREKRLREKLKKAGPDPDE